MMLHQRIGSGFLVALALSGCGGSGSSITNPPSPPPPPPPPTPVPSATVDVRNNFFDPATVALIVGGQVTWNWVGQDHNVTSVLTPGFAPTSPTSNAPFTHGPVMFPTPGTYRYVCTVHGGVSNGQPTGMNGTIVVQ